MLILVLLAASLTQAAESTRSIDEIFRQALARSERIADSQSVIEGAEATFRRALFGVLPSVQGLAAATFQDQPAGATGVSSQFTQGFQPNVRLNATQPLFRGLREFFGIRQASRTVEAEKFSYQRASQLLYVDVAATALERTRAERELAILTEQIGLLEKRRKELQERASIGRSRKSEVYLAESSISNLEAQRAQVEVGRAAQDELLAFFTGQPATGEAISFPFDMKAAPAPLEKLESYLETAVKRPDLAALAEREAAANSGVWVARGALFPSADLSGNYYLQRAGVLQDVKWDVQFLLTVPIFNPAGAYADIRNARVTRMRAELAESQAKRDAEREIRVLYASLVGTQRQIGSLVRSREYAERNFIELSREYRLGLVTNLETIQALSQFKDAERSLERARVNFEVDRIRLRVAAGRGIPGAEGGA